MTSKLIYTTIPDLCKLLGIEFEGRTFWTVGNTLMATPESTDNVHIQVKILSPNDTIPTDECEKCGKKLNSHLPMLPDEALSNPSRGIFFSCMAMGTFFKPILRRIKKITLVERCECGRRQIEHIGVRNRKPFSGYCKESKCKQYKPVQTVELEVE